MVTCFLFQASWTECKPKLDRDPQGRATNPDLDQADAEKLFREHVKDLYEVMSCVLFVTIHGLFAR